ncbi:MAG: hypothetical protein BroJett030_28780 [Alphaproteobacteria bacterium]|nr:MAG: hypothetical protein BroJett030_28780 [Alphaproteobacteria bacterium]
MENLVDRLGSRAESHPDRALFNYCNLKGEIVSSVSYAGFDRRTSELAAGLRAVPGVAPGRPVLLAFGPRPAFLTTFFACVKTGAIPVPVPAIGALGEAAALERLGRVALDCGATTVLHDGRRPGTDGAGPGGAVSPALAAAAALDWIDATTLEGGDAAAFRATPGEVLFLQYTSGSTGAPRGVTVSHANVLANCPAPEASPRVTVSWLPHYHDMGLIGYCLFPLLCGDTAHLMSPADFLRRPAAWLELMSKVRASHSAAPNFAFEFCLRPGKVPDALLADLDLSSLRDLMNASEPVRWATQSAFARRFARCGLSPSALNVAYGLAENTLRVTTGGRVHITVNKERLAEGSVVPVRGGGRLANGVALASCGRPVPGVDIRIVDPDTGAEAPDGRTGEIWVSGASKARGYWGKPQASREIFAARIAGDGAEYLRTGDIGFVEDGELYVCGRIRDMVVLRGRNVFPNDVEAAIAARFPEIEPHRVAVFGHGAEPFAETGLIVLVEAARSGAQPALADIHRAALTAVQAPVDAVVLTRRGAIPRTSSGKIARHRCQTDYAAGRFAVLDAYRPADAADGERTIEELLDELLGRAGASGAATPLGQLGLDSIELVELSLRIEELAQGVGITEEARLKTVYDLRLLQSATIGQVRDAVAQLTARTRPAETIARDLGSAMAAIELAERQRMRADTRLDPALRPEPAAAAGGPILLTGATGFVGSFLAEALLRRAGERLVALVRAESVEHGRMRLRSALLRTDMAPGEVERALAERIEVACGDITRPRLGLAEADWRRLSAEIATVHHCAAEVDYIKTYDDLRPANVAGTGEIIRLCCAGRPKALNFVSTTFVFGWTTKTVKAEGDRNSEMEGLDFGYPQSKWVAEQLVHAAADRGLTTRVFRPSLITAARHGRFARGDVSSRMVGYCIRHGIAPASANQVSFLPVEVCANNIAALAAAPDTAGQTFHLTANHVYTLETVCRLITELYGYSFAYTDLDGFVEHINSRCGPDDDLYPLKPFFNNSRDKFKAMDRMRYDNRHYQARCARLATAMAEPPLAETVTHLVDFLIANRLVPAPGRRQRAPVPAVAAG